MLRLCGFRWCVAACLLLLVGCQTQLKFEREEPRKVSELVWDDYDGDGHDEPRQAEGVEYTWHARER